MNSFFGQVFQVLQDAASNLLSGLLGRSSTSVEEKFMQSRMKERLMYVNSAIQVQEEEKHFLESHMTMATNAMVDELELLKRELQALTAERKHILEQLETVSNPNASDKKTTDIRIANYQQTLKIQLAEDKPREVLDKLIADVQPDSELYNDVILLSAKLRSVNRQKELGLIASAEYSFMYNNWIYSLLQLIDRLEAADTNL